MAIDTTKPLLAHAMYLGQRLDLRSPEKLPPLATNPLTIAAGTQGLAVLFRYGVVVFFGLSVSETSRFIDDMRGCIINPYGDPEVDEVEMFVSPDETEGIFKGRIRIQNYDTQRLQIVADVMAKNVVLGHYETDLNYYFDKIEPLAARLNSNIVSVEKVRRCCVTSAMPY